MVLVQRILLDFLLLAFPMRNGQLTKVDMAKIVKSVINVVLRRDMSLNRRLYAWLLGTGASNTGSISRQTDKIKRTPMDSTTFSGDVDLSYFHTYSEDLLIQALKQKLANPNDEPDTVLRQTGKSAVLKPFRILMSLLDKPEIGPVILESVLLSVFQCLYRETGALHSKYKASGSDELGQDAGSREEKSKPTKLTSESKTYGELIKTANLLFGTFEPYFIWDYIARMFEESCQNVSTSHGRSVSRQASMLEGDVPSLSELCTLVDYLLEVISLVGNSCTSFHFIIYQIISFVCKIFIKEPLQYYRLENMTK